MFGRFATAISLVTAAVASMSSHAWAAGGAYAVDTAEISEVGSCKVETWNSVASNHDLIQVGNPSCVVNPFKPVEISAQWNRTYVDEGWTRTIAPKAKTKLLPTAIGSFGFAMSANATYDLATGGNTAMTVVVPATLRFSNVVRLNLNAGWQWDRIVDQHYFTYGAGVDWRTPDNIYTFTAEVYGQVGSSQVYDFSTVTQPRFQAGLRFRPIDVISFDFIYGRNINGENANWFTFCMTVRFPATGGKGGGE